MRVLDIDLDFFLHSTYHGIPTPNERLDADRYAPWDLDKVIQFLTDNCRLTGPPPGVALERHNELFFWWRDRINDGRLVPPFSVTHIDGHADLGLGDTVYFYWMTQLLHMDVAQRPYAPEIADHLKEGNFLAFAIACQWLSNLTYVRNEPFGDPVPWYSSQHTGPTDILKYVMKDKDVDSGAIQLYAIDPQTPLLKVSNAEPVHLESEVPFRYMHWPEYVADEPFDVICLVRSPEYTPEASDRLYAEIKERFIDETAWC